MTVTASLLLALGCKRKPEGAEPVASPPPVEYRFVLASVALVRARPDPGAEVLARRAIGTRVEVKGRAERFLEVESDGVRGYLFEGLLSKSEPKLSELIARHDAAPPDALEDRRTWAERAAALAPDDEEAVRRLVEVLEKLGDQKALHRARRGLDTIRATKAAEATALAAASSTQTSAVSAKAPSRECLDASPKRSLEVKFDLSLPPRGGGVDEGEEPGQGCPEAGGCSYSVHDVGAVVGPICAGARLLIVSTFEDPCVCKCEGVPSGNSTNLRFLELEEGWVPVSHRDTPPRWALEVIGGKVLSDLVVEVAGLRLDAPEEIDLGARKILRRGFDGVRSSDQPIGPKVHQVDGWALHEDGERFVLPRPDGTAVFYERFIPELEEGFMTLDLELDETKTSTHARTEGRYVYLERRPVDHALRAIGRVRATGAEVSTFGETIPPEWAGRYESYADAVRAYREAYGEPRELLSQAIYLAKIPHLLWRDPFGELHMFVREELVPPEIAEPLVYLYAPSPTKVRLDIGDGVALVAADPPYEGGWSVRTRPDGRLEDLASGRVLSAIFWEGRSVLAPEPKRGLVVARSRVRAALEEVLPKLGLAPHEVDDFVTYWAPRLRSAPYYRLSFLDTKEVEPMASLEVTPRPDVSIRVHMDAWPLSAPIETPPLEFRPVPPRKGLVLVEWSGFRRGTPPVPYFAANSPTLCVPRRDVAD